MDSNNSTHFELPVPVVGNGTSSPSSSMGVTPQNMSQQDLLTNQSNDLPTTQLPQNPASSQTPLGYNPKPIQSVPQQNSQLQPTSMSLSPQIADDIDVIEQEWVKRAKYIVEQTKNDPFNQAKEVGKLKADYIQKRFGKEIKVE